MRTTDHRHDHHYDRLTSSTSSSLSFSLFLQLASMSTTGLNTEKNSMLLFQQQQRQNFVLLRWQHWRPFIGQDRLKLASFLGDLALTSTTTVQLYSSQTVFDCSSDKKKRQKVNREKQVGLSSSATAKEKRKEKSWRSSAKQQLAL